MIAAMTVNARKPSFHKPCSSPALSFCRNVCGGDASGLVSVAASFTGDAVVEVGAGADMARYYYDINV
jgi:hypothetical protein